MILTVLIVLVAVRFSSPTEELAKSATVGGTFGRSGTKRLSSAEVISFSVTLA
jgi:hypothetical protein